MVFNGNYGVVSALAPTAVMANAAWIKFIPVCGAMRRNHPIKE